MTRTIIFCAAAAAAFAQVPTPQPQVPDAPARPAQRSVAAVRSGAGPSYRDLSFPAFHIPETPKLLQSQLANGIKLVLIENHEAPQIAGAAFVRAGSAFDPDGLAGLATVTAAMLRTGGARQRSPEQLDAELETLGATLESNVGEAMAVFSFVAARANLAPALSLFHDVVTAPSLRADRLDRAKSELLNAIARRNDDARLVLRRELLNRIQPGASRAPEYATAGAIQRADVERFYRRYYFPANTMLVFSGDFGAEEMKRAVETAFAEWQSSEPPVPELAKPGLAAPGAIFAPAANARQAYVAIGVPGATFRDADAAALDVAAALLGAIPHSRLSERRPAIGESIQDLRAEAAPGIWKPGVFVISGVTSTGAAADVVAAAVDELQKLRSAEPAEEELRVAKQLVALRACDGLDNRLRTALIAGTAEYFGYPSDYLQQYLARVAAVTRADVLRIAKDRLDPAKFTSAAVANLLVFADPRGVPATTVDLTIPTAPAAPAPARAGAASPEEAKKLLARAQQASGGIEKLAATKDMAVKTAYALAAGGTDDELDRWIAPSTLRQDGNSSLFGRLVRFTDGTNGWLSNGYASGPMTGDVLRQALGDLIRQPVSLLLSDRVPGRTISALDEDTVEIVAGNAVARVVFDRATGLPAQLHYEIPSPRGQPVLVREDLSDYRDVNGIQLPFHTRVYQNGAKFAEGVVSEIKLNQGLQPEVLLRRP